MLTCISQLLTNQTFWIAVTAIATVILAAGVIVAVWQFRLGLWIEAQNIYVNKEFFNARKKILTHFDKSEELPLNGKELAVVMNDAILVCQRMDELAGLKQFFFKKKIIKYWGIQMAKSCLILENFINDERKHNSNKWDNLIDISKKSIKKHKETFSDRKLCIK
jgi:hypothetical protein